MADALQEIAEKYDLRLIVIYGSTVTGAASSASDIDIGVWANRPHLVTPAVLQTIAEELRTVFPARALDVGALNSATASYLKTIILDQPSRAIWGDPSHFAELKMQVHRRYLHYRPYLNFERRFVRQALTGASPARPPDPFTALDREHLTQQMLQELLQLSELERLALRPRNAFVKSFGYGPLAERLLERLVSRLVSINHRLLHASGHPLPNDPTESFQAMAELGVLSPDLATLLVELGRRVNGFRRPDESLDSERLYDEIQTACRQLRDYLTRVEHFYFDGGAETKAAT